MSSRAVERAYSATGVAWQDGPGRVYDPLAERLVAASPVPLAGRLILDLGAGTGAATRAIQAASGTSIAADVAVGMLQAMASPVPARTVADARLLPFADASVDGVVAAFSLNHVPDPDRALREAVRVARPGSPLLVSAYAAEDAHPIKAAVDTAATEAGWRAEAWVEDLRSRIMPTLASAASARRATDAAGLRGAEIVEVEVAFPHLGAEDLVAWRCGMAQLAPFVAALRPSERERLRARAVELVGSPPVLVRRVVLITTVT